MGTHAGGRRDCKASVGRGVGLKLQCKIKACCRVCRVCVSVCACKCVVHLNLSALKSLPLAWPAMVCRRERLGEGGGGGRRNLHSLC